MPHREHGGGDAEDDLAGLDGAAVGLEAEDAVAVVDAGDAGAEPDRQVLGVASDEGAIAFDDRPIVHGRGIFIGGPVVEGDAGEGGAVGEAGDGVDHRAPGIGRIDKVGEGAVGAGEGGMRCLLPALPCLLGCLLLLGWEAEVSPLGAPIGWGAVYGEAVALG